MRTNKILGIVFPNTHDDLIYELTEKRATGSIPFGARYRMIDFSLSNLVNAGISKVCIITKANYQSLMNHLGNGKPWDLDRKNGGIYILSPFSTGKSGVYTNHIEAIYGEMEFIKNSPEEYVVLCDADVVMNFDVEDMVRQHSRTNADITVCYKNGYLPKKHPDTMSLEVDQQGRVVDILVSEQTDEQRDFSLDVILLSKKLLIRLIEDANSRSRKNFAKDIMQKNVQELRIFGYKVDSYAVVIDSLISYYNTHFDLLNDSDIRRQLFTSQRPVYTKTRDDMPTKYGLHSYAVGSLVADGCKIDGTVINSVISRGVCIGENAVVKNCIILEDSVIGNGSQLDNVIVDKLVRVNAGERLSGTKHNPMYVHKNTDV
ncbi:MAG: glucose-1-phosphate adenylyltransferase subunit GlgD [bacterium]|nr:glucose-1-phosphate adenylyltransferase subunit GlgD [bacterium]